MAMLIIAYIFVVLLDQGSPLNRFEIELIKELSKNYASSDNFAMSPLAATQALAMLYFQKDKRRDYQLAKVLRITGTGVNKIISYFSEPLQKGVKQQFMMRNRIYFPTDFTISEYMKKIGEKLHVDLENLDFTDGQQAGDEIINWLGKSLENVNPKLWTKENVTDKIKLVAIQGLSVATLWKHRFLSAKKIGFITKKAKTKIEHNMQMMYSVGPFPYLIREQVQGVTIPFSETNINLIILIPRKQVTTQHILENLPKFLALKMQPMEKTHLFLPALTLQKTIDLNETLQSLGLKKIFADDKHNPASIFKQHSILIVKPNRALLNYEDGNDDDQKTVIVNKPFVFVIKDRRNIYMVGRVNSVKNLPVPL